MLIFLKYLSNLMLHKYSSQLAVFFSMKCKCISHYTNEGSASVHLKGCQNANTGVETKSFVNSMGQGHGCY